MPTRRLPNTTPAVLRTLQTASNTAKITPPAEMAISADQLAALNTSVATSLISRFIKETNDVDVAMAAQAPLTSDLAIKAARLTMLISHFHQVLDLGIERGYFGVGARSHYDRDITATALPDLTTYDAIATAGAKVISGEAARQTAEGAAFKPMALPSAAEVSAAHYAFTVARSLSQTALTKTDQEREQVTTLYPEAQALAEDICDTVEFYYRKDPIPSSRRAKCKRWGVVYLYKEDEPQDPEAPTPPAPPTP